MRQDSALSTTVTTDSAKSDLERPTANGSTDQPSMACSEQTHASCQPAVSQQIARCEL